ncbi:hypothetical protein MKW98_005514 [Papaver atlanticum]|uniref:Pectinesterase n=1 Tax=Papaver atlanticum TaxID=357466 RepID=A0AAD4S2W8_9MAGN|nr:hypothetical protein MKW98_005514 [Papaver atlanticum]
MMNTTTNNSAAAETSRSRTSRKKWWILLIIILTITLTIGAPLAVLSFVRNPFPDIHNPTIQSPPLIIIINETCTRTLYPSLCFTSFSSFPSSIRITSPERLLEFSINGTVKSVQDSRTKISLLVNGNQQEKNALNDCIEMLDQTLYELEQVSNGLRNYSVLIGFRHQLYSEFKTLLSASMTNENTCIQGIEDVEEANPETHLGFKEVVQRLLNPVSKLISNCLAMVKYLESTSNTGSKMMIKKRRPVSHGFPAWMTANDRKLMQIVVPQIMSNTTVAAVGHGNYRKISAAVRMAPSFSLQRYVIKIKAGVYNESVEIPREKSNIMLVGDGMDSTIITGCKNFLDAVIGARFLARDLTVINTSGPEKQQAVAVRVTSDSSFYKCNFASFQDTLYVHSLRQFYRECTIQGTVDFIFGNAAAIFQNCLILVRKPIAGQKNMITAQGREDPNQNTGISLQNCTIEAAPDLITAGRSSYTFLGRPWRNHSRTIYSTLDTVEYIEYMNVGPGSDTRHRVTWGGYRRNWSEDLVEQFTVGKFLHGADNWLESTCFISWKLKLFDVIALRLSQLFQHFCAL